MLRLKFVRWSALSLVALAMSAMISPPEADAALYGLHGRHCAKPCCQPVPQVKICVMVPDPCNSCCKVPVTVCVPACCVGEPCATSRCGLFRTVTHFEWDCGVAAKVSLSKSGRVRVRYY